MLANCSSQKIKLMTTDVYEIIKYEVFSTADNSLGSKPSSKLDGSCVQAHPAMHINHYVAELQMMTTFSVDMSLVQTLSVGYAS